MFERQPLGGPGADQMQSRDRGSAVAWHAGCQWHKTMPTTGIYTRLNGEPRSSLSFAFGLVLVLLEPLLDDSVQLGLRWGARLEGRLLVDRQPSVKVVHRLLVRHHELQLLSVRHVGFANEEVRDLFRYLRGDLGHPLLRHPRSVLVRDLLDQPLDERESRVDVNRSSLVFWPLGFGGVDIALDGCLARLDGSHVRRDQVRPEGRRLKLLNG
jgi:hypothetical protein